jgi:tetratricopeptide (TPR) repeat protein
MIHSLRLNAAGCAVATLSCLALIAAHAQSPIDTQATPPLAQSVSTQDAMPADPQAFPEAWKYLEQSKPASALAALQKEVLQHENDPRFFNLIGVIALRVPDYAVAASAFERVVVMQPENAGAWTDLAIANVELGNNVSALAYFEHIESTFNPPPELRAIIARYRQRLATRTSIKSPWHSQVQVMTGIDSNANSGLQNSVIALNFGDERLDLILDPGYRARSDHYVQAGAAVSYQQQLGINLMQVGAGVQQRLFQNEHDFSTLDASLNAGLQRPTALGDAAVRIYLEHLTLGGKALLRNVRAVAELERPQGACRIGAGVEGEWRRYNDFTNLDANIIWAQTGLACDWSLARMVTQTTLIGRIGFDTPTGARAGGASQHAEIIAQIGIPLPAGIQGELSTTLSTVRDKDGYSPLLEKNAVRHLERSNVRLLLSKSLNPSTDLLFLAEDNRYYSNLSLFVQNGQNLSVGVRHRF